MKWKKNEKKPLRRNITLFKSLIFPAVRALHSNLLICYPSEINKR